MRFLLGLALGYVAGARAGRDHFERLATAARDLAGSDLARSLRAELATFVGRRGDPSAQQTDVGLVTPPVIVGPGPRGMAAQREVVVDDADEVAPETMPAKRLEPPSAAGGTI